MMVVVPQDEGVPAADDSRGLQLGGNVAGGGSGAKQHDRLAGRFDGHQQGPSQPTCCAEHRNHQYPEDLSHNRQQFRRDWKRSILTMVMRLRVGGGERGSFTDWPWGACFSQKTYFLPGCGGGASGRVLGESYAGGFEPFLTRYTQMSD